MGIGSSRLAYIATMHQHIILLATLCNHVDIKASIFLSLVAVMLFAYVYSPVSNLVVFALGLAFAVAFPVRTGVAMLADRPVSLGGGDLDVPSLFSMGEEEDLALQRRIASEHKIAILHNTKTLKDKHRQNRGIIVTSLMLFGYLMGMTMLFMAIAPQPA